MIFTTRTVHILPALTLLLFTSVLLGCSGLALEEQVEEVPIDVIESEPEEGDQSDDNAVPVYATQAAIISQPGDETSTMENEVELSQPAVPEERLLVLEWPGKIRTGDSDLLILKLEIADNGEITPTAEFLGHEIKAGLVEIPNVYDTHSVVAQARLDMVGVDYTPRGEVSERMRPGDPVQFIWSVRPREVGSHRGTIWVHLEFVPLDDGEVIRQPLSAQVIEIDAVNLLGLGGTPARVIGAVGTFLGAFLGLDKLLPGLLSFFRRFLPSASRKNTPKGN